ncbi:MAG: hypothetical protein NT053_14790 [Cyanobacteria bacterium]|nr:hypothetical protein [Cyanobacteriota bacterium]
MRQPHGLRSFRPPPLSLSDQLLKLASGAWVTQMIHVAAELGVADQLTAGGRPVEELAEACGAEADGLFRLLRGPGQPGHLRGNGTAPVRAHAAGGAAAQRAHR